MQSNEFLERVARLIEASRFDETVGVCQEFLAAEPRSAAAWFALGFAEVHRGRLDAAETAFKKVVEIEPENADAWSNLSLIARDLNQPADAEEFARRSISIRSDNAVPWLMLGDALASQEKSLEALGAYEQSLSLNLNEEAAWFGMALMKESLGQYAAAQQAFERCLALQPRNVHFIAGYARFLNHTRDPLKSLQLLDSIPESARLSEHWIERAHAQRLLGDFTSAEAAYRAALGIAPSSDAGQHGLALTLLVLGRIGESEQLIREQLASRPKSPHVWALLAENMREQARSPEAVDAFCRSLEFQPSHERHSKLLLSLQCLDEIDSAKLLAEHRDWSSRYAAKIVRQDALRGHSLTRPLRIAFLSADFTQHPSAFMVLPAIESLDREKCFTACYSDRIIEDGYTARFREASSLWCACAGLSDEELAKQIETDEIDVLVDLAGHAGKRMLVFARHPAPLQITWFGYVGTTGLDAMDCLLADRYHVPPGDDPYYVESVLRMPNGYACYQPPADAPPINPLPALSEPTLTFGSFNNPAKYSRTTYDLFAAVLNRVPSSRLLLKFRGLHDSTTQRTVLSEFASRGIAAQRILLDGAASHLELMASYNRIDLALDTQPYSGGVTTCEALWMGIPVITCPGQTFAGRHATSHLTNAGYPQFIAKDIGRLRGSRRRMGESNRRVGDSPLPNARPTPPLPPLRRPPLRPRLPPGDPTSLGNENAGTQGVTIMARRIQPQAAC